MHLPESQHQHILYVFNHDFIGGIWTVATAGRLWVADENTGQFRVLILCLTICPINPLMLIASKKQPDSFDEIFQVKAYMGKYLKEKCNSEHYQQYSLKYFT